MINFVHHNHRPPIADLYSISYMYLGVFGVIVTFLVGILVSLISGKQDPSKLHPGVLFPPIERKFKSSRSCKISVLDEDIDIEEIKNEETF